MFVKSMIYIYINIYIYHHISYYVYILMKIKFIWVNAHISPTTKFRNCLDMVGTLPVLDTTSNYYSNDINSIYTHNNEHGTQKCRFGKWHFFQNVWCSLIFRFHFGFPRSRSTHSFYTLTIQLRTIRKWPLQSDSEDEIETINSGERSGFFEILPRDPPLIPKSLHCRCHQL